MLIISEEIEKLITPWKKKRSYQTQTDINKIMKGRYKK